MVDFIHKDLFLKNSIPKKFFITSDTATITNTELHQEKFSLKESLCSESYLAFGSCEASEIEFTVSNVFTSQMNKELTVRIGLNEDMDNLLTVGKYKVYSNKPTANRKDRVIKAYDAMHDILNADVLDWYNSILPSTGSSATVKQFRDSFISHFGLEQEETTLINDDILIRRTVNPEKLSGKDVITKLCEMNGCFGHIGRNGKFKYIYLEPITESLYPSDTLYPADDLYPREANTFSFTSSNYISANAEDYIVEKITRIQIRQDENEIGAVVGNEGNDFIIQDNFLLYGKSASELDTIAQRILDKVGGIYYRPFEAKVKGNPCLEVGDGITIGTKYMVINSYILQRILTGIQSLRDNFIASGQPIREDRVNGSNSQIQQIKGRYNKLTRTVDETRLEMGDMEKELYSTISVTASELRTELSDVKNGLESSINQTASQIRLEVSDIENDLQSQITQTASQIRTEITALDTDLQSQITQNATSITAEVKRAKDAEEALSASITVTAEKIESKVSEGEVSSVISQESGKISIDSNRLSISSTYFSLTEAGKITASEVDLTGKITAESGKIGGFTITDDEIYNGSKKTLSSTSDGVYLGSDGIGLGSKFKVTNAGVLTATDVDITGKVTAESGEIGGFAITDESIYNEKKSMTDYTSNGIYIGTDGVAFGKGKQRWFRTGSNSWSGKYTHGFSVTSSGEVVVAVDSIVAGADVSLSGISVLMSKDGLVVSETPSGISKNKNVTITDDEISIKGSSSAYGLYHSDGISGKTSSGISGDILNFDYSSSWRIGFFGKTPAKQQSASDLSGVIQALKNYGLLS